ncbi:MAG: hypothetical protein HQL73_03235 [Magnetococcales bacterium]|nr:hypothetical protein [Magnetococcales bacterium]
MNNNATLSERPGAIANGIHLQQSPSTPSPEAGEAAPQGQLTSLSFTTELSASDINRLLKIFSANDLP